MLYELFDSLITSNYNLTIDYLVNIVLHADIIKNNILLIQD